MSKRSSFGGPSWNFDKNMTSLQVDFETQVTIGEIQWLLMAAQHRLARVGFWEASQGSEGFLEGSLDVLLTSVGAVINGHVSNLFQNPRAKMSCF